MSKRTEKRKIIIKYTKKETQIKFRLCSLSTPTNHIWALNEKKAAAAYSILPEKSDIDNGMHSITLEKV
jgi:hypothetical protein